MNEIKTRLMAALVTALLTGFSGCLGTGCIGHGSRTLDIQLPFGQSVVITDTVLSDEKGEQNFSRTLDPDGWKFVFGWLLPDKEVMAPPAPEAESDGE